jgi:hypothetical protein
MKPGEYKVLIQQFLDGSFEETEEFARIYDKTFLSETGEMSNELFGILEDFWEDVDAYSPLWDPEDIDKIHITEQTLKVEARKALEELVKYLNGHSE